MYNTLSTNLPDQKSEFVVPISYHTRYYTWHTIHGTIHTTIVPTIFVPTYHTRYDRYDILIKYDRDIGYTETTALRSAQIYPSIPYMVRV